MKRNIYLLVLFLSLTGFRNSGTRTISGTVYDKSDGSELPGVTLKIKGTNLKTITDRRGKYSITFNEGQRIIVFSNTGYNTKEVETGKSDTLNVWLQPMPDILKDVEIVYRRTPGKPLYFPVQSSTPSPVCSDTRTIRGFVYETADRFPLPGITVKVIRTITKTETDRNGHYIITFGKGSTKLVFACPGFDTQEIKIGKSDTLDVKMVADKRSYNLQLSY